MGPALRFPHYLDGLHKQHIMLSVAFWIHVLLAIIAGLELATSVVFQRMALALFLLRIGVLTLR